MNNTNCIFDWKLYRLIKETSSKQKFYFRMETFKPANDWDDLDQMELKNRKSNEDKRFK